jgi:Concanavalin A-like lectin/glucanases superfamily
MTALILVLVPVLVLAVVVLFAFAGCQVIAPLDEHRSVPHYSDVILPDPGLRSYWRLDEAANASQAADSARYHRAPGIYQGGVSLGVRGVLKGDATAADFDGVGGHVVVRNDTDAFVTAWVNPPGDFSIEAWIKPTATTRDLVVVSSYLINPVRGFELVVTAGGTEVQVKFGGNPVPNPQHISKMFECRAPLGGATDRDGWHHVVGTCITPSALPGTLVSSTLNLYVNGARIVTGPEDPGVYVPVDFATKQPFYIGRRASTSYLPSESYFSGGIDEVALYGVALDATPNQPPVTIMRHFDAAST